MATLALCPISQPWLAWFPCDTLLLIQKGLRVLAQPDSQEHIFLCVLGSMARQKFCTLLGVQTLERFWEPEY